MRILVSILILSLLCGIGVSFASSAPATLHALTPVAVASPIFLQQSGPAFLPATQGGGGASAASLPLPSSVLNHLDPVCSVEAESPPATCSIFPGPDSKCSAHCDGDQHCTAFFSASGLAASCSTFGKKKAKCSTLQPPVTVPVGSSECSAFSGSFNVQIQCSVMAPEKKQACSSQNPPGSFGGNVCSAFGTVDRNQCSVLGGGTPEPNYCSTGNNGGPNPKTCSSYSLGSICSIGITQNGRCTNFMGAAVGTCSVQGAGFCSVIGGSAGTNCIP